MNSLEVAFDLRTLYRYNSFSSSISDNSNTLTTENWGWCKTRNTLNKRKTMAFIEKNRRNAWNGQANYTTSLSDIWELKDGWKDGDFVSWFTRIQLHRDSFSLLPRKFKLMPFGPSWKKNESGWRKILRSLLKDGRKCISQGKHFENISYLECLRFRKLLKGKFSQISYQSHYVSAKNI